MRPGAAFVSLALFNLSIHPSIHPSSCIMFQAVGAQIAERQCPMMLIVSSLLPSCPPALSLSPTARSVPDARSCAHSGPAGPAPSLPSRRRLLREVLDHRDPGLPSCVEVWGGGGGR